MTLPAGWQITEGRGRAGLCALKDDWQRLYGQMPGRTSFLAFESALAYLEHCHERPDQVRCLVLRDPVEVRAICLLEPRIERRLGLPVPVWGVLWMKRQCNYGDIVCPDPDLRRDLAPLLAGYLRLHAEGRPLLALGPLEPDASLWDGLQQIRATDLCADRTERIRILDCRAPYPQAEAACSKKHRRALKTARKNLAELPDVRFRVARGPQALAAEFPALLAVEASGWKGAGRSAIRDRRGLADHLAKLANSLTGERDYCEIVSLYSGDRCLASAFVTCTGPTCSILKIGYDEAYGQAKPGHLLIAHIVERACADPALERVNFVSECAWLHGWHSELMDVQVVYVNIGGPLGRPPIDLLRLRLGPLRRLAGRIKTRLHRPEAEPEAAAAP